MVSDAALYPESKTVFDARTLLLSSKICFRNTYFQRAKLGNICRGKNVF